MSQSPGRYVASSTEASLSGGYSRTWSGSVVGRGVRVGVSGGGGGDAGSVRVAGGEGDSGGVTTGGRGPAGGDGGFGAGGVTGGSRGDKGDGVGARAGSGGSSTSS